MRGWERRIEHERRAISERRARARAVLPALVQELVRFGATEVYLFGSLCAGAFRRESDIDLGVRGIPPE